MVSFKKTIILVSDFDNISLVKIALKFIYTKFIKIVIVYVNF